MSRSTTSSPLSSPGSALSPVAMPNDANASVTLPPVTLPVATTAHKMRELEIPPTLETMVDEDQEMAEAPPVKDATITLPDSVVSPVVPSITASAPNLTTPSLKDILKKTLVKKEKVQRDYLIAMNSDSPEDAGKADKLREDLDNLEKHVKALTSGLKVHRTPSSGLKISKRDLPKFQFEDSKVKPFPQEDCYKSVDHFLSEFEKIVHSSGQEIQDVWRKYIPLTLPFDLDDWLQNIVLKAACWADVKSVFHKKFGTTISKLHKRRAVMTMSIGEDETVDEYASRFFRTVGEAGYHRDDLTIGDIFLLGLPEEWQFNLSTVLLSRTKREAWTSTEILDFATNLMGEKTPNTHFASRKGDDVSITSKRRKIQGHAFGGANSASFSADVSDALPKARMLGDKNQRNRATKNLNPCRHCGRPWRHGHTCEEYRAQKRQKNANVLSIASTSKEENEALEPVNYKEQYENEMYKCESKKTKTNNTMKLITPLLLNNRRVIGKVDPGSDISFINKSILNKTFSNIRTFKTNGFLNFLSVNDDNKNSTVTRVGKTEPMEVTYTNNIKFSHEFEVIEFNDELSTEFDVLLGVDILPKTNIYLQGVAYKFPDSGRDNELKQFQDINHDKENKYDPENADYGTPSERKELLPQIQTALDANKAIPSDAACTVPESIVKIKITDPSNCFVRQYPLPANADAEINTQLEEWLKDGIVERAKPNSTYHSPLLAVPKRDSLTGKTSKLRICCDLRRINAAISDQDCQENFAVPKIDEIFGKVADNANVISVLDLKQAYFAFPVSSESRRCLTFSHNNLTYRWARAPFGLKFLVSQFVYTMSVLFDGIEQELKEELKKIYIKKDISQIDNEFQAGICHYLDDIVIFAKSAQINVLMVNLVINRLTKVNLRINTDKCSFFQTSVHLLGFIISKNITKIDTKRLSNIDTWEIPKTTKQLTK